MVTYICLPNLLAGGLPAGALPGLALAASIASHTRGTTHARPLLVRFLSAVLCLKRVWFVFEVCVGVVLRVCEAMEAASARPGSAPAGKPPAKRLGKHRASHVPERCRRRFFQISKVLTVPYFGSNENVK